MGPSLHWVLAGLIALVLVTLPCIALAWGAQAHRLVASLAWTQLTPATQAEVSRLLALEPDSSFESISTWADEVRSPCTATWHYLNLPRDANCRYDAMRSCPGGHCAVAAIQRQLGVLGGSGSDPDRLKALKYLVHLVADVDQPLHAGFADDRGGNQYQVQAFGRGTNLHALWDKWLLDEWPAGLPALQAAMALEVVGPASADPVVWAESSCRIVSADSFYPRGHRLDGDYARRWNPVLARQLAVAANELSTVLNGALGDAKQPGPTSARP
jgi:hypothetical protein